MVDTIKFNDKQVTVYADLGTLEPAALDQFQSAMAQPWAVKGALMPDAHTGYSLPIGGVVATDGVIVPAWVGYDIGCGMAAVKIDRSPAWIKGNADSIFDSIYRAVPTGFSHNEYEDVSIIDGLKNIDRSDIISAELDAGARKQLGTLGSGNHFIEIGHDEDGYSWVIVHSGSRNLGHKACTHYMKLASGSDRPLEGHYVFDVSSENGIKYITDLNFCLEFALANRKEIIRRVIDIIGGNQIEFINCNHNHAELKDGLWIHRKGATHAENGMMGVIPGNMRDGSFIVRGKGNPDSLCSSSHGAGRIMGRTQAIKNLDLVDFVATMNGIKARVGSDTLDESPFCYKNIFHVMEKQKDLIDVLHYVRPIINIKDGSKRKQKSNRKGE